MQRYLPFASAAALAAVLAACGPQAENAQQAARSEKSTKPVEEFRSSVTPLPATDKVAANAELSGRVQQALQTRTTDSPAPVDGQVEATAVDGVVTLFGTVNAASEKERAALLALGVQGVRSVVNNLEVTPPRT